MPGARVHLVLAVLLLTMTSTHAAPAEDDKLNAFFTAFLEEEFKKRPVEATRLGDHRFDSQMDELTGQARAAWTKRYRATLADLPRKVDAAKLSRSGQIDYEILGHHLTK